MRRVNQNQDKLNYELNIDVNCVSDHVQASVERTAEFLRLYAHTDMKLDENILSKDEYRQAQAGKRHFRDAGAAVA